MHRANTLALTIVIILLIGLAPASVGAVSPPAGTDYVVQPGDSLSRIAENYYGDAALYPAIVWTTNARAAQTSGYATIMDPWVLEPGDKLYLMPAESIQEALTSRDIANGVYASEWTKDGTAPLTNGRYSESIVEGSASKIEVTLLPRMAFGKTTDGQPLVAAVLYTSGGGSGTFGELLALTGSSGQVQQLGATPLGDRVQIKALAIVDSQIVLTMLTHGPSDPMCCPTQTATAIYALQGGQLVEQGATNPLQGMVWQWQNMTDGAGVETAVSDPSLFTLQFAEDKLSYRADCNTGSATVALDGQHMAFSMLISTRAFCGEDSLETLFKQALELVESYAISGKTLTLALADGGSMTFAGVDPLLNVVWQWQGSVAADGGQVDVADPTLFTVQFDREGTYGLRADCNVGSGAYSREGSALNLEPGISTLAHCGDESLDTTFRAHLGQVVAFEIVGDQLILTLADGGTMTFAAAV